MTPRHEIPTGGTAPRLAKSFQALVPRLETERLILRAPCLEDFPGFLTIMGTDRGKYCDGPLSREDTWFDFIGLSSCWMLQGHGGWSITLKDDEALQGFVILGLEPGDQEVELGYLLLDHAEGQGIATEAVMAARDWAFDTLGLSTLASYIDRQNHRSIGVAQRVGAVEDTPDDWNPEDVVYRHHARKVLQ